MRSKAEVKNELTELLFKGLEEKKDRACRRKEENGFTSCRIAPPSPRLVLFPRWRSRRFGIGRGSIQPRGARLFSIKTHRPYRHPAGKRKPPGWTHTLMRVAGGCIDNYRTIMLSYLDCQDDG